MKNSLYIILALLAGLVIGNFSVKPDLRTAREEIKSLKGQLNLRSRRDDNLRNITSMLRVPEPTRPAMTNSPRVEQTVEVDAGATNTTNVATGDVRTARSFKEDIESAVELWKTRSELARNSLLSNVSATPEQTQMFDQAVTNMNAQLGEKIRQWTDYLKQQQEVTPESGMRMMNDLSSTVITAYDELDSVFAADWRDKAGAEFQMFDFINPEVALPFAEVQGTMGDRPFRRSVRPRP